MSCLICEYPLTEMCHLIPRRSPMSEYYSAEVNIIPLCPNHHKCLDGGYMGGAEMEKLWSALNESQRFCFMRLIADDYPLKSNEDEWCWWCMYWLEDCGCMTGTCDFCDDYMNELEAAA